MERLTIQTGKGAALKMADSYESESAARQDLMVRYRVAVARLAQYEDKGLEPEEAMTAKEMAEVARALNLLKEYQSLGSVEHFRELSQAEQDGRLVVLPCNDPLTIEELREMDGEPVWITPGGFWALVIARPGERVKLISNDGEVVFADKEIELAGPVYRRKPEKGERE